jgi:hypothetical protein
MPTEHIHALLIAERDKLYRAVKHSKAHQKAWPPSEESSHWRARDLDTRDEA